MQIVIILALGYALVQTCTRLGEEKKTIKSFDPYNILGLETNATDDDIKLAYRRLARELHPDKNPDDPEAAAKFILLTKAYQALSDEEGKRNYMRYGNPEGPGALHVGIALPEFLIKKENHVTVLVVFFLVILVLIPGLALYWFSSMSQYNKHGIYEENSRRYAPELKETLPIRRLPFIIGLTAEFAENLTLTTAEEPELHRVLALASL
jgi:translocation protein SEC63